MFATNVDEDYKLTHKMEYNRERREHSGSGRRRSQTGNRTSVSRPRSVSPCSNRSKDEPENFKQDPPDQSRKIGKTGSEPSIVSLASDQSKHLPYNFEQEPHELRKIELPENAEDSSHDFKHIRDPHVSSNKVQDSAEGEELQRGLDNMFQGLEEDIVTFVKDELQRLRQILTSHNPECLESEDMQKIQEAVLNITLDFMKKRKQEKLAQELQTRWYTQSCRHKMKRQLQQRSRCMFEGVPKPGLPILLNQIYTELWLTEGGASEVNQEHEVRQIENMSRKSLMPVTIACEDIFKDNSTTPEPHQAQIRTMLTKGVAGIGKTVLTKKFILDWAEGRANQNIQLLFPFTFRELNVLKGSEFSLVGLLHHFFNVSLRIHSFDGLQVLFIFDGLDECRLSLDFGNTHVVTEPTESVSVEVLLVNLFKKNLLPDARLWITTRPAAASQIPAECVSMVTEVQGFSNTHKEQYFRKRFGDEQQATDIISHIEKNQTLYIMCRIPVFSWILSTVFEHVQKTSESGKLPHTLTQIYIYFLVVHVKLKGLKYDGCSETDQSWTPETLKMVQTLGKLAFEQLEKGNLIFYESELGEYELDAVATSLHSGVFTQVMREEQGLYQDKIYCFIHLTMQEFLAALYVHHTFYSSQVNLLSSQHLADESSDSEASFYSSAVDKTLQSPNGHLDLFLRFLLGLSQPTNQKLLLHLLTRRRRQTSEGIVEYIKKKLNEGLSAERCLNLLHCLSELNDTSLVNNIQWYSGQRSKNISPAEWSGLAYLLLSSDSNLDEFDLWKFFPSESAILGLLPVIKASTRAILCRCNLSPLICEPLASVLKSNTLTHLDLSNNNLQDSGVKLLCSGLRSPPCRLVTLRLSGCLVSEKGGASLESILRSTHCSVRELDLSYNNPGPSADRLTALQNNPKNKLDCFRWFPAGERWMIPGLRKYAVKLILDPNTANRKLVLVDQWEVRHVEVEEAYSDHRDRFDSCPQILCSTGLTGSCFWEVEWSGPLVYIAASYKMISRKEDQGKCLLGDNEWSWNMRIFNGKYSFRHNGIKSGAEFLCSHSSPTSQLLPQSSSGFGGFSGRVGIFLDSVAGSLSFYEVLSNGELFHLHTFSSSFFDPLFPAFGLWFGASVSLVNRGTC